MTTAASSKVLSAVSWLEQARRGRSQVRAAGRKPKEVSRSSLPLFAKRKQQLLERRLLEGVPVSFR
jgi:hypothetical protein